MQCYILGFLNVNMKLEQKFESVEPNHINYLEGLVEVADDFAIGFAEWRLTTHLRNADQYTMCELLKIYKEKYNL